MRGVFCCLRIKEVEDQSKSFLIIISFLLNVFILLHFLRLQQIGSIIPKEEVKKRYFTTGVRTCAYVDIDDAAAAELHPFPS